ncbi:Ig-like domain-containing protein, partial [Algoriphagus marinus]|uniref:Ig-like domain-containing protein n=1 Tax=Algoriphagus marinus TaxID=1925762 RepID=UPI000B023951
MKKTFTKYFLSLIALFGVSISLMEASGSHLSINTNLNSFIAEDSDIILKTPFVSKNTDFVTGVPKLLLNTVDFNEDLFNSQVYEIKSNNFVQLVAEPFLGYLFSHWSIDGKSVSENIVYEFLMPEKDVLVSANYIQIDVPSVQIKSPVENSVYTTSDVISVDIEANSTLGQVEKVELFINDNLVYTSFVLPYKYELKNYSEGKYNLKAVATDNTGQSATSKVSIVNIQNSNVAPTISIISPNSNSQFLKGDNVNVTVNATDTDGTITKVEFYNGNTLLGTDTTSPYSFAWTNLPVGNFTLTAKATDNKGAATVSSQTNINVVEMPNVAPTVSITAPNANAQFTQGDNANITATASDADGTITKVEFYNGTTLLGTDTASPYSFAWTNLPIGNFTLTAKATDDKGTATVSAQVNINVAEKSNVAPTVSLTAPNSNAQFTQGDNASITAIAADADGTVTKVEFYNGTTLLGTDTTSPYSFAWTNLPVGNFTLTAKATDNKGTATVSAQVNINVVEKSNVTQVESFTLINADTNLDLFNLTNGMQMEGSIVSDKKVNIRANTNPSVVGSVYFTLSGQVNLTRLENAAPYALYGDNNGVYFGMDLPVGAYTLTAVTYSGSNRGGEQGPIRTITFSVVDTPNVAPTVSITAPKTNAQFTQGDNASITATAADSDGTITKVEFYNGTTLLGTDTTSPYSFAWTNLSVGNFTLTAKATDNKGTATVSAEVNINVVE